MRIPSETVERAAFFLDIKQKCMESSQIRKQAYARRRNYYLQGCDTTDPLPRYNKIFPLVDQLSSFLYSADATKFSIQTGATFPASDLPKISPVTRRVNDVWGDTNTDMEFSLSLNWALVYDTTLIKLVVDNKMPMPFMVDPGSFGVLREDVPGLSRQEAVCFTYYVTKSELWSRYLRHHPGGERIMDEMSSQQGQQNDMSSHRMLISAVTATSVSGLAPMLPSGQRMFSYEPTVTEETVEMTELWVRDDEINDYRVITIADPMVVIFDRPGAELFLRNELPFVQVCPNPMPDYFWGSSEVDRVAALQDMLSTRLRQIEELLGKQVSPPTAFSGFVGDLDEIMLAFDTAGGKIADQNPSARAQRFAPDLPDDLFKEVDKLGEMFGEQMAITPILSGKGESGVRSEGHAAQLSKLGASRAKKRALIIQNALESVASLYLKVLAKYDDTNLKDENGQPFIMDQLSKDCTAKVDSHSNSPIFSDDNKGMALDLLKAGLIDGEDALDLLDPPKKDFLKEKFKLKQKQQQAQQAQQAQAQQAQAQQNQPPQQANQAPPQPARPQLQGIKR
jgi:hypothetical protein